MFSSCSFVLFVKLVVDLDSLGDEAQEVVVSQVAGGVLQHPGLAVVVPVYIQRDVSVTGETSKMYHI